MFSYDGNIVNADNPLTWTAGSILYLKYDSEKGTANYPGGWVVVDSGAYSCIKQTADNIRSEVAYGFNYMGSCTTSPNIADKEVTYSTDLPATLKKGLTVAVTFSKGVMVTINKNYL
jgi:hypothetical protein